MIFIQFKNTVDPTWMCESTCEHQPAILPGTHYLDPERCWAPMTTVQAVSLALVAQHFSKTEKIALETSVCKDLHPQSKKWTNAEMLAPGNKMFKMSCV